MILGLLILGSLLAGVVSAFVTVTLIFFDSSAAATAGECTAWMVVVFVLSGGAFLAGPDGDEL